MTSDEICRIQAHFNRLDDELSSGLTENVSAESTVEPDTSPPCAIRLIVLEFSGQEHGDEDLEDTSLDGDDGDDTQNRMRGIPKLKEPLQNVIS